MNAEEVRQAMVDCSPSRTSKYTKWGEHPWGDCTQDSAIALAALHRSVHLTGWLMILHSMTIS
jgi:hypothetical protein